MYSLLFYKYGNWSSEKILAEYNALPSSRKVRVDSVANNAIYKEFLIVEYAMLKNILSLKLEQDFCYTPLGKPYIDGSKHFNISHCEDFLVIAVSNTEIGVDVEKVKEYNFKLANKVFNVSELAFVEKSKNKAYQFAKLWTQKEAKAKLLGRSVFDGTKNILNDKQGYCFETKRKDGFVITVYQKKST